MRKCLYATAVGLAMTVALASSAWAAIPEIDARSGGSAIALIVGALFLVAERRRRRS